MKYSFVFAAALSILAAAPFAVRGEEAALTPLLSECKTQRGVVLVTPEAPHTPLFKRPFCADDLKRFDCQILSHIENYMFYSYGGCENNNDMFMQNFGRPACSGLKGKELVDFNRKVIQNIPEEVRLFFFTLRRTEYEKGCLPPNFTPQDY